MSRQCRHLTLFSVRIRQLRSMPTPPGWDPHLLQFTTWYGFTNLSVLIYYLYYIHYLY